MASLGLPLNMETEKKKRKSKGTKARGPLAMPKSRGSGFEGSFGFPV
jgi:hypothetical protein